MAVDITDTDIEMVEALVRMARDVVFYCFLERLADSSLYFFSCGSVFFFWFSFREFL